jgi:hypothetical protein
MTVYLTDSEIKAILSTCSEWSSIMGDGEDTFELVEERMNDGLGSALRKISKGTNSEKLYNKYKTKR